MTYVWFALGGLALLVATLVAIGMLMPQRYVGRSQVVYAKPTDDVWNALLDYDSHPMTGRMKKSVEAQPDDNGLPVWIEEMGQGDPILVKTVEAKRPIHLVREMTSETVPMTSRWEYTLEPSDQGCALTIDGETYIRNGTWHVPLFRLMMVLGGGVKKGLDIQLDMIAETLGVQAQKG